MNWKHLRTSAMASSPRYSYSILAGISYFLALEKLQDRLDRRVTRSPDDVGAVILLPILDMQVGDPGVSAR
jgi:hypothetical protein